MFLEVIIPALSLLQTVDDFQEFLIDAGREFFFEPPTISLLYLIVFHFRVGVVHSSPFHFTFR